jgi:hypothetical protein
MAVIKIVPMPGAVGDKGDEGAVGPRGQQGETGLQGPAGADALWSYNGEYNPGAGYAVGDVVTYNGQLWYRKNSNGGNVGDTPSEGLFWDLLAAKGTDSITPTSGTWDTRMSELCGITGGLYGGLRTSTSEEMNKGRYYTIGDLVFFEVNFIVTQPSFSSIGRIFNGALPFPVAGPWQTNQPSNFITNTATGIYQAFGDDVPIGITDPDEGGRIPLTAILYGSNFSLLATTDSSGITETDRLTTSWPVNLHVPNTETVLLPGSPGEITIYSPTVRIYFTGVYRKA